MHCGSVVGLSDLGRGELPFKKDRGANWKF